MAGWLVLALVAIVGLYILSLVLHPYQRCFLCKGTGRHPGLVFTYAFRPCRMCGGSTRQRRLGHRLLFGPDK